MIIGKVITTVLLYTDYYDNDYCVKNATLKIRHCFSCMGNILESSCLPSEQKAYCNGTPRAIIEIHIKYAWWHMQGVTMILFRHLQYNFFINNNTTGFFFMFSCKIASVVAQIKLDGNDWKLNFFDSFNGNHLFK